MGAEVRLTESEHRFFLLLFPSTSRPSWRGRPDGNAPRSWPCQFVNGAIGIGPFVTVLRGAAWQDSWLMGGGDQHRLVFSRSRKAID